MTDACISFSGCGFLGIYHVGVASCIKQYAPSLTFNKVGGASAGALVATVLTCNCCLGQCTSYVLRLGARARRRALGPLHPDFDLVKHLRLGLEEILPMDAHVRCSGRIFISVTRVSDGENVMLSNFPTREHLIQALLCSSFIPLYAGMTPPTFEGVAYVDGGFSNNLPTFSGCQTVTVCPFAGESDICPRDAQSSHSMLLNISPAGTPFLMTNVNINRLSQVLFPPHPVNLSKLCQEGFRDALRFLSLAGYIDKMPDIIQLQACVTSTKAAPVSRVGGRLSASTDDEMANSDNCGKRLVRRNSLESLVFQRYRRRRSSTTHTDSQVKISQIPHGNILKTTEAPKRSPSELNFLPPLARREFMAHLADSQGIIYSLFHSSAYRFCSILASPLYLPAELSMNVISKVTRYSLSCVKSLFSSTLGRLYHILENVYSAALLYSPIVITSQPDGRLMCSLDVVADRLNGESAEQIFRKNRAQLPSHQREDQPDLTKECFPKHSVDTGTGRINDPLPQHMVYLHLNSSPDDPNRVRRLTHGRVDSQAATDCLDTLLQRSASMEGIAEQDTKERLCDGFQSDGIEPGFASTSRTTSRARRSNTIADDASAIERLVGGRGKPSNTPVLSYYYPDPQTDQLLVWELKELDS